MIMTLQTENEKGAYTFDLNDDSQILGLFKDTMLHEMMHMDPKPSNGRTLPNSVPGKTENPTKAVPENVNRPANPMSGKVSRPASPMPHNVGGEYGMIPFESMLSGMIYKETANQYSFRTQNAIRLLRRVAA